MIKDTRETYAFKIYQLDNMDIRLSNGQSVEDKINCLVKLLSI